ncbi:hypothetical protein Tco_0454917 [Tanacetum coccineum]
MKGASRDGKGREERQRQQSCHLWYYIEKLYMMKFTAKMDSIEELAARLQWKEKREIHNQLNKKTFEEIQALYIKEQKRDADFMPIGSKRDENMIDKMNKKAAGMDEEEVLEEPESRRLKMKATKKSKRQKIDFDLEEEEQLRASLKIVPDEEEEIDYEVLCTRVFRANGSLRYIKTFTEMVSRFDILDSLSYISFNILALRCGTEISMLAERWYLIIRETLERMMELRLSAESEGEAVLDLLRFIQK